MVYQGSDLNPLYQKPIYWGLLGLLMVIITVYDFRSTYLHGPEHRSYLEITYDSCYSPFEQQTGLEKLWSALSRNQNSTKPLCIITTSTGAKFPLRSGWKPHLKTLQDPALKGSKMKLFYPIDDKSYQNPIRIEVNGRLLDDLNDDYTSPFAYLALSILFLSIAGRLQWKIWQKQFASHPSPHR